MEMQDKEFDQLFASKLEGFEVEPSAQAWQRIACELDGKKTKWLTLPHLSIAASLLVLAAAAVWFFDGTDKKAHKPRVKLANHIKTVKPLSAADDSAPTVALKEMNDIIQLKEMNDIIHLKKTAIVKPQKAISNTALQVQEIKQEVTALSPENAILKPEPVSAVALVEKPIILRPVAPVADIEVETAIVNQPKPINEVAESLTTDPIPGKNHEKKRARGLGGLFNTIIAAVDKREDKLIEFTDAGNDEGTRVTGVNLGIFKIKKQ